MIISDFPHRTRAWFFLLLGLSFWTLPSASIQAAAESLWDFSNEADPLAATSGSGTLGYYDPDGTGWGEAQTAFGLASSFGLPPMTGGDPSVMRFPACTSRQGYRLTHGAPANGAYGDTVGRVSNYTLVMDLLFPSASDGRWRALYQTDPANASDAEFYVLNEPSGGIGIIDVYHGSIQPNTWHRVAIVMQSAPGEGKCQRFIDGRFVGGIGSSGSGLDIRWALQQAFLLFTENDGETASGYVGSIYFVDRALRMEEVQALGGAHAGGAHVPGATAPDITQVMPRRVGVIGHRGGFFCCTPDNTLAAVRRAITNRVPVIEIDTRLSSDGACVLMHDSTVDRTTDGTGTVVSKTVPQLKQLDAGSWFSPDFAGERIPTIEEVMALARGKMILYFDLKVPGQITAIMSAIADTDFNPDDLWFWTYDDAGDTASIRSQLPNAKIIWGTPPANWDTDVNAFEGLRAMGVYGFDLGIYYGNVNELFVRAAKEQGFVMSIYTILDPDTMVRNSALGVDYMETDFPQIMNQVQPPQSNAPTGPIPADGAVNVKTSPTLGWITGSNAVIHHVRFGSVSPPPVYRDQSFDTVALTNLTAGSTYYWQVTEEGNGGMFPGPIWSFTVTANPEPEFQTYEWSFDRGDLSIDLGEGLMEYTDGVTAGVTTFGVTDGAVVPHVGGQSATYMRVPQLAGIANGYYLHFNASGPNGGGVYINQFTWIADFLVPGGVNWAALFNTDTSNGNDADFYVDPTGRLGIGELGYSAAGLVGANTWYRVAFTADLGAGRATYYLNGNPVHERMGASIRDGRFSLYSNADPGADLLLFNEGAAGGPYTHELYVASIAFQDRTMAAEELAALGGPNAEGIFLRDLHIRLAEGEVVLEWRGDARLGLQRSGQVAPAVWQDVPGTLGQNSYVESMTDQPAFFRLARD